MNVAVIKSQIYGIDFCGDSYTKFHVLLWEDKYGDMGILIDSLENMNFMNDLSACRSEEEIEELMIEKHDALCVSSEEFYQFTNRKIMFRDDYLKKLFYLCKELHQGGASSEEESRFQDWAKVGLRKFSDAKQLFMASENADLIAEFRRTPDQYFLYERYEQELHFQEMILGRIQKHLTEEKFETFLDSFKGHYVLGMGAKPCKGIVIRYLRDHDAWSDFLLMDDGIIHGQGQERPITIKFSLTPYLSTAQQTIELTARFTNFINARINSRSDARFTSKNELQITAGEARYFW